MQRSSDERTGKCYAGLQAEPMFLPENQKRLTNVSVVSLKKFGKRYELAVYPNKLYEYRNGMNTPLSEILHTDQIFASVSKGKWKLT